MRDERGKKLEVLISSSSQVKILLTMDDRRGEKKTKERKTFTRDHHLGPWTLGPTNQLILGPKHPSAQETMNSRTQRTTDLMILGFEDPRTKGPSDPSA